MQGHNSDLVYKTGGNHNKPCSNCDGGISPCFYKDAINVLTKAVHKCQEKYPFFQNINLQKFIYDQYFNKEYTYLHKLTGLQKLPYLPFPWCFETAVKKSFPNKTYKGFVCTPTNPK